MKLTRTTSYAIAALAYIATNAEKRSVPAREINQVYDIPLDYLLKVLKRMVRSNILYSLRGPGGGYVMAHRPDKISLLKIIEAVEGPIVTDTNFSKKIINPTVALNLGKVYREITADISRIFSQTTLADLMAGKGG